MKTMLHVVILTIVFIQLASFGEQTPPENHTKQAKVSLTVEDVSLTELVVLITRIADVSIAYTPEQLDSTSVSVNVRDKNWRQVLDTVLAQHKLALAEEKSGIYSIIPFTEMNLQELTGVVKKASKRYSSRLLELDGETGSFYLRGDILENVPDGTRVWVKGTIKTELYDTNEIAGITAWPTHWQIFMDVKECKNISKPFERPGQH